MKNSDGVRKKSISSRCEAKMQFTPWFRYKFKI